MTELWPWVWCLPFFGTRCIWPVAVPVTRSVVCVSVCVSVTQMSCAKTVKGLRFHLGLTFVPKEPCIRWGLRSPIGSDNFGGFPAHKETVGVSMAAYAAKGIVQSSIITCSRKDHLVLNNSMTARLLQPTAMLLTGRYHIASSPVKNPPLAMRPFIRILWHLFCSELFIDFPLRREDIICAEFDFFLLIFVLKFTWTIGTRMNQTVDE